MFISAPKNNVYIHVYVHIIISIIVVKLPYIREKPLNIFKYLANINDTIFSPIEPINAPGICDSIFTLCFGINLYIAIYIKNVNTIYPNSANAFQKKLSKNINLLCNISIKLFPNTSNTSATVINIKNITVLSSDFAFRYIYLLSSIS